MRFGFAKAPINTTIKREKLVLDDMSLVCKVEEAKDFALKRKSFFDLMAIRGGKYNYLDVKLAKLAYELAKEEFDNLSAEAAQRGLIMI